MTKPNRLQNALRERAQGPAPISSMPKIEVVPPAGETGGGSKESSRVGKVMISAYMPKEVRSSFRLIQAKHPDRQMQDLMAEAFNDLFAKYNVPQTSMLD